MTCPECKYWIAGSKLQGTARVRTHYCIRFPKYEETPADYICGEFKRPGKRNERSMAAQRARDEKPRRIRE